MQMTDLIMTAQAGGGALTSIEIALLIFFAVFVLIVIWVVFSRPGQFKEVAQLPLEDNEVITPRICARPTNASEEKESSHVS